MTIILHGIVHGKNIEVREDLAMLDGQAVQLIVTTLPSPGQFLKEFGVPGARKTLPGPPPGWRPVGTVTAAGLLADEWTEADDESLIRIHAERKATNWRELPE